MSDCRFGVSPVNYPDPDSLSSNCHPKDAKLLQEDLATLKEQQGMWQTYPA